MTPQEQDMIGGLIDRVQKTQLAEKDTDAEQMLQQGLGRNPDSLYILAQTVLVQKYALDQALAQLNQAREQIQQMQQHSEPAREPRHATSFLGSLLGRNEPPAPPPPPAYNPQQAYPPYAPVPPGYTPAPQYGVPTGMSGGGFLQGALQTAAGVAAGALAFQGVESLMHGFGHTAGYGQELSGLGGGVAQRPEEVINNYYGNDKADLGEKGDAAGHAGSTDEHTLGAQENRDFGGGSSTDSRDSSESNDSNDNRDLLYDTSDNSASNGDSSFDSGASAVDDSSFNDTGSDFGDDGSGGGGDESNFA